METDALPTTALAEPDPLREALTTIETGRSSFSNMVADASRRYAEGDWGGTRPRFPELDAMMARAGATKAPDATYYNPDLATPYALSELPAPDMPKSSNVIDAVRLGFRQESIIGVVQRYNRLREETEAVYGDLRPDPTYDPRYDPQIKEAGFEDQRIAFMRSQSRNETYMMIRNLREQRDNMREMDRLSGFGHFVAGATGMIVDPLNYAPFVGVAAKAGESLVWGGMRKGIYGATQNAAAAILDASMRKGMNPTDFQESFGDLLKLPVVLGGAAGALTHGLTWRHRRLGVDADAGLPPLFSPKLWDDPEAMMKGEMPNITRAGWEIENVRARGEAGSLVDSPPSRMGLVPEKRGYWTTPGPQPRKYVVDTAPIGRGGDLAVVRAAAGHERLDDFWFDNRKNNLSLLELGKAFGARIGNSALRLGGLYTMMADLHASARMYQTGVPLIVDTWHGSPVAHRVATDGFDPDRLGELTKASSAKQGFFFAKNATTSIHYAKLKPGATKVETEGGLVPVRLRFENPLVLNGTDFSFGSGQFTKAIKNAKAEGHDGVIFKNMADGGMMDHIYVAFDADKTFIRSMPLNTKGEMTTLADTHAAREKDWIAVREKNIEIHSQYVETAMANYRLRDTGVVSTTGVWNAAEAAKANAGESFVNARLEKVSGHGGDLPTMVNVAAEVAVVRAEIEILGDYPEAGMRHLISRYVDGITFDAKASKIVPDETGMVFKKENFIHDFSNSGGGVTAGLAIKQAYGSAYSGKVESAISKLIDLNDGPGFMMKPVVQAAVDTMISRRAAQILEEKFTPEEIAAGKELADLRRQGLAPAVDMHKHNPLRGAHFTGDKEIDAAMNDVIDMIEGRKPRPTRPVEPDLPPEEGYVPDA